jgi:hypothetical protein
MLSFSPIPACKVIKFQLELDNYNRKKYLLGNTYFKNLASSIVCR